MPRTLHIIGYSKDGKTSLIIGPEKPVVEVRSLFLDFKNAKQPLPKDVVEAHVFDSEDGRVGIAYDEKARRKAAESETVRNIQAQIAKIGEHLDAAKKHLKALEDAHKTGPEVTHTKQRIAEFQREIAALEAKIKT